MRLITLSGGLGNQMFQYAFYVAQKKRYGNVYFTLRKIIKFKEHNGYELNRLFGVQQTPTNQFIECLIALPLLGKLFLHLLFRSKYRERKLFAYDDNNSVFSSKLSSVHLVGYWQSERYFLEAADEIKQLFQFKTASLNQQTASLVQDICDHADAVSVHVRRGDYQTNQGFNQVYGNICTEAYYQRAIERILGDYPEAKFYLFTDDPEWCARHFQGCPFTLVDWNSGSASWQDLYLMTQCKHHILANSSFSWWGAYLGQHPSSLTLAPDRWVNDQDSPDIVPAHWIRIATQP